jgi:hypothetical protein
MERPAKNALAAKLGGPLDTDAMVTALTAIAGRHEVLWTCFPIVDGEAVQRVEPPGPIQVWQEGLSGLQGPEHRARAAEQLRPYDLKAGPLARDLMLHLAADDHVLAIAMHHILCDASSFGVMDPDRYRLALPGDKRGTAHG